MKKIDLLTESGLELSDTTINGISVSEIENFLSTIDNESFEHISLYFDEKQNLLCFEEEVGVVFPQYGHFITKIAESKYAQCFDFV